MKSFKISLLTKTLSMLLLMSIAFVIGCSKDPDDDPDPTTKSWKTVCIYLGKERQSLLGRVQRIDERLLTNEADGNKPRTGMYELYIAVKGWNSRFQHRKSGRR
jgi:hypothetical protein